MRKIQNTTESDSSSDINSETGDIVEVDGWETEYSSFSSQEERNEELERKLINLANKKANLANILKNLNLHFIIVYSASGWTHNTNCPLIGHNDNSPSFWFNSLENRFNCFGCSRGGGPVQFLSYYSGKKQIQVAKELIKTYGDLDDVIEEINDETQRKIDDLILKSSDYIHNFIKNNKNNPKLINFAENLLWSLDVYLEKSNFAKTNINLENLEQRINIIKRKLGKFE